MALKITMHHFISVVVLSLALVMSASFDTNAQQIRKLYYNKYWELTTPDSAQYYRECTIDSVRREFAGSFTDYHFDGVKLTEGAYVDGKMHGVFSNWFHNGQLESEGNFIASHQTGTWKYFYPDGRERQEVLFDDAGFRVKNFYDSTGRQLVTNGMGHWYEFYEEYRLAGILSNEGNFVDGKKEGTWTTAYNGIPFIREKFVDGKFIEGLEMIEGKTTTYTAEFLNKLLPHYKYGITVKLQTDKSPLTPTYYPFLFADGQDNVFTVVEQPASFDGGLAAMYKFVMNNLQYPKAARNKRVEGSVFVSFIVEKDGLISNVSVVKGIGLGCDEEAVRIVSSFPKWNPGLQNGRAVKSKFVIPIKFKLGV